MQRRRRYNQDPIFHCLAMFWSPQPTCPPAPGPRRRARPTSPAVPTSSRCPPPSKRSLFACTSNNSGFQARRPLRARQEGRRSSRGGSRKADPPSRALRTPPPNAPRVVRFGLLASRLLRRIEDEDENEDEEDSDPWPGGVFHESILRLHPGSYKPSPRTPPGWSSWDAPGPLPCSPRLLAPPCGCKTLSSESMNNG